jgi:hypothetical protein
MPIDTNLTDDEIWDILYPANKTDKAELAIKKKRLQSFLQFIASNLSKNESQRLCRIVKRSLVEGENSLDALMSGIDGQRKDKLVFIQVDWRASDEIAWQAAVVLKRFGVNEQWICEYKDGVDTVFDMLMNLSRWLLLRDLALMHLETNADFYCSFIVKTSDVVFVKELAMAAELVVYNDAEFVQRNIN